jgi:hypothetical protein
VIGHLHDRGKLDAAELEIDDRDEESIEPLVRWISEDSDNNHGKAWQRLLTCLQTTNGCADGGGIPLFNESL